MQRIYGEQSDEARALELIEAEAWADMLDAAPPDVVERLGISTLRLGDAVAGAVATVDHVDFNRVVGFGTLDIVTDAHFDELLAYYADAGVARWMVQWSPAALPSSTPDLLRACGFHHQDSWLKLHRSASALLPPVHTDLRVERVGGDRLDDFARIWNTRGYPVDAARACATVIDRPGWRAFMAFDGDTPVATAALFVRGATAWIGFGATDPRYRGRGAQSALIAARVVEAHRLGCETIVAETDEDTADRPSPSFRNAQRLGFQVAYARPNYVLVRGAPASGILGVSR